MDAIEDVPHLAALKDRLAVQAHELNRVFMRAIAHLLRGKARSIRDIGRAPKAQNQCRAILLVLIALRAAEQAAKNRRTN